MRTLRKKLQQIEGLERRAAEPGAPPLDAQQRSKVAQRPALAAALEALISTGALGDAQAALRGLGPLGGGGFGGSPFGGLPFGGLPLGGVPFGGVPFGEVSVGGVSPGGDQEGSGGSGGGPLRKSPSAASLPGGSELRGSEGGGDGGRRRRRRSGAGTPGDARGEPAVADSGSVGFLTP